MLEKSLSSKVLYRTYSSTSSSMYSNVGEILIKQSIIQNVFINTSSMYSNVGEILIKQSIIQNVFINIFFYVFYCWRNPHQAKYYTERIHQHLLLCILMLEKSSSSKVLYRTYSSTSSSMYSNVGEILIKQSIIQNVFINIFFYAFYCWRNPYQAKYYTERIHQHLLCCWRNPHQAKYYTERIHQHLLCILMLEKSSSSKVLYRTYSSTSSSMYSMLEKSSSSKVLYRTYSSTSSMYSNVGEILIKQSIIQNVFINNFFYVFYCWRNPYQAKYYTERIHQHLLLCILMLEKSSSSKVLYRTYSSTSSMYSNVGEILIKQSIIQNVFINIFFYVF